MELCFCIILFKYESLVGAEGDRNNHSLTLSSSCFSWLHCTQKTQKRNGFFCLPIPLFPQNHSLHQPVSLSLPEKGLGILKQNALSIQNYHQLTAPKQCNERLAQQRSSEIYTGLRSETCSQTPGKKCFSGAKDQYHANHYDKQARLYLAWHVSRISDFCSSLPLVTYEASAPKIMQQPRKKISNYNQVNTMLKFSIPGKGLKMAGWINEAFSRTSGWCFRIPAVFSESQWCP